ncbi:MAG: FtsH protease activity modulator HflK [Candidatus Paceibacterota bacterium]
MSEMSGSEFLESLLERWEKTAAAILAVILVLIAVFSSPYKVDKNQEATVRRLGAYVETVGPGLHFKVPLLDYVVKTDVTSVHRIEVGFRTIDAKEKEAESKAKYRDVIEESEMLTGDYNIALVDFVVQYRSSNAKKWQFTVEEPEKALSFLAQSAMRLVVGRSTFDNVATSGKVTLQTEVRNLLQHYADQLDFGVQIVSVQLQDVQPPKAVVSAFKDVVNAREDKEALIQNAHQHANKVLPDARGAAARIGNEAEAYARARTAAAVGDVSKFSAVLAKYKLSPEVTARRLMFETQERVLRGKEIIVDSGSESSLLKLFQINPNKQ